jgi:hypothetical protein
MSDTYMYKNAIKAKLYTRETAIEFMQFLIDNDIEFSYEKKSSYPTVESLKAMDTIKQWEIKLLQYSEYVSPLTWLVINNYNSVNTDTPEEFEKIFTPVPNGAK